MSNDALSSNMSVDLRQTTTPESKPLLLTNKDTSGQNLRDSSGKLPDFKMHGSFHNFFFFLSENFAGGKKKRLNIAAQLLLK